ncbi:hypothetical protein [Flexivirga caeni]|uniref:hypothetical protein n=1 Tax=Flexivirga caeni TaxID=2294115 RepID=UPI0011CEC8EE|nr:hypothetical protein [Flexivirga caeni]
MLDEDVLECVEECPDDDELAWPEELCPADDCLELELELDCGEPAEVWRGAGELLADDDGAGDEDADGRSGAAAGGACAPSEKDHPSNPPGMTWLLPAP